MSALACRYASEEILMILYNVAGRDQEERGGPLESILDEEPRPYRDVSLG